jgi:hypothetical protein
MVHGYVFHQSQGVITPQFYLKVEITGLSEIMHDIHTQEDLSLLFECKTKWFWVEMYHSDRKKMSF